MFICSAAGIVAKQTIRIQKSGADELAFWRRPRTTANAQRQEEQLQCGCVKKAGGTQLDVAFAQATMQGLAAPKCP
jgi:hypothetical protein